MNSGRGLEAIKRLEGAGLDQTPLNYLRAYYEVSGQPLSASEIEAITPECLEILTMTQGVMSQATDQTSTLVGDLARKSLDLSGRINLLREVRTKDAVLSMLSQVLGLSREIHTIVESGHRELMVTCETIRQMRDELAQARILMHEDPLTGANNRRGLNAVLEQELARSSRSNYALSVAMLDIDHFKKVNDLYGHDAGDKMLIHFTGLIRSVMRKSDVLFRYGGEEFTLVLPETDARGAKFVLGRLQQFLDKTPLPYEGKKIGAAFSAGVAVASSGGGMVRGEELIRRADKALYKAKENGRGRIEIGGEAA
jgi:diguanylate cyclase